MVWYDVAVPSDPGYVQLRSWGGSCLEMGSTVGLSGSVVLRACDAGNPRQHSSYAGYPTVYTNR